MAVVLVAIAVLYWAQKIVIPLAFAVLFAFLLAPLVGWLQQLKLPRFPAVLIVVALALALLYGILRVVYTQLGELARGLPQHFQNITRKFDELRNNKHYIWNQIDQLIHDINSELQKSDGSERLVAVMPQQEAWKSLSLCPGRLPCLCWRRC